jgi:hypothetical protein
MLRPSLVFAVVPHDGRVGVDDRRRFEEGDGLLGPDPQTASVGRYWEP